jgi:hypothetical protein
MNPDRILVIGAPIADRIDRLQLMFQRCDTRRVRAICSEKETDVAC